jgi:hypothetical protein
MFQFDKRQKKSCPTYSVNAWAFSFRIICKAIVAIALTANVSVSLAQKAEEKPTPVVNGQIFNIEDGTPVAFAVVTNHRTKESVSANLNGIFTINATINDSLEISSLGFQKETIEIPSVYNVSEVLTLYARPLSFLIPDINVTVKKEQMKIDKENRIVSPYFRNEIMKQKPASEKAYDNQISLLSIPLGGKKDRSKLKVQAAEENDRQWASLSRVYNKELVVALTNLNNTEADNFMMYLNGKNLSKRMTTKQNATYTILQQFQIYKSEGH